MHVLIVEDDFALGQFLDRGLRLDGHQVCLVADGEAALESAETFRPDLMILDMGLPLKDGLEVLAEMGERFRWVSVMVLTGRADAGERVRCLDLGADDVLPKPFSFQELLARMKALGRRRTRLEDAVLRFGDVEMDRTEHRVMQAGREVELTQTEFSLLESLLRRRGEQMCTRVELLREVWRSDEEVGTNIVEVYINYLRRKLGQTRLSGAGSKCVIRTVRGEGYILGRGEVARFGLVRNELPTVHQAAG